MTNRQTKTTTTAPEGAGAVKAELELSFSDRGYDSTIPDNGQIPPKRLDLDSLIGEADLVRLVEQAGGTLKQSGSGYRGPCPLHGGDNPTAFSIYSNGSDRQRWHCFTQCDTGGDAIDFVRAWKRLPDTAEGFIEAVKILADTQGVSPNDIGLSPAESKRIATQRKARQKQSNMFKLASDYYADLIHSDRGSDGLKYAKSRGWTDQTITEMKLGYSDGNLLAYFKQMDADLGLAQEIGLIYQRDNGTLTDTIPRGYLIYPHKQRQKTIYLSGRAVHSDDQAKKARNIRGPRRPFWAIKSHHGPLIVVEGQACAITAWQWGYNAVALCGQSLSNVDALDSFQDGIYLALDADANDKIKNVADVLGPLTMIISDLPAHDLNAWLQEGGDSDGLATLIQQAEPWIEVAIEQASKAPAFQLQDRLEHLAQLMARIPHTARQPYYHKICTEEKLSSKSDFDRLLIEYDDRNITHNGYKIKDGRLAHYGNPLCNFQAQITHELAYDDGLNPPELFFTLDGKLDNGEKLPAVDLPAEEFEKMRWVGKSWGARPIPYVTPGQIYKLHRAILETSQGELQRERVHTFTGWTKTEEQWLYLTTSGGLGADGMNPNIRVDLGVNNLGRYALPSPPRDLQSAIRASLDFLNLGPLSVTIPIWAAMYAAPLTTLKPLNAVLWLYGPTQSGKSTLAHLALCHFGQFIEGHDYKPPNNWTSTITDIEGALFRTKDIPLIIDDYAPAHSGAAEARDMAKKAHRVVRSVGNRASRGRARSDLSEQTKRPPRGLVIVTAENPLVGQSIVGRMIYVPIERGDIISDNHNTKLDDAQQQAMSGLYSQAMAGYIRWLARQWGDLKDSFPKRVLRAGHTARKMLPTGQSRLTDYYGVLSETIRLALEYAADHGAIPQEQVSDLAEVYRFDLVKLLESQGDMVTEQSPVVKFWQAISDLFAQGKVYFAPRIANDYDHPDRSELIGWYNDDSDPDVIYLLTNTALSNVKQYWQSLDERFDTLVDALQRELYQQGFVSKRGIGNHLARKTYIKQNDKTSRIRTLWLDAEAVFENAQIDPSGNKTD